jgi:CubicO group peptidase (beta-lactamase class C family)
MNPQQPPRLLPAEAATKKPLFYYLVTYALLYFIICFPLYVQHAKTYWFIILPFPIAIVAQLFTRSFAAICVRCKLDPARKLPPTARTAGLPSNPMPALPGNADEQRTMEKIRKSYRLPALAFASVTADGSILEAATGVREANGSQPVTTNDCFHLGSCTKPFIATLVACLVHRKTLDWSMTIPDLLPDLKDTMHPMFRSATLYNLLSHQAGFSHVYWPKGSSYRGLYDFTGDGVEQRREYSRRMLAQAPAIAPGKRSIYSNANYVIAGAACERVTSRTWENLVRDEVHSPLGMTRMGVGAPDGTNPLGHIWFNMKPVPPGVYADLPTVIGPAGSLHGPLREVASFLRLHLLVARGQAPALASLETLQKLQQPGLWHKVGSSRAWLSKTVISSKETALWHSGTNGLWTMVMWIVPRRGIACVAASNCGGLNAYMACERAVREIGGKG